MRLPLAALALLITTSPIGAQAPAPSDRELVRAAVEDYVEGFYQGDTTRLDRALARDLHKYGFWRPRDSTSYQGEAMSWRQAMDYAASQRKAGRRAPDTAPRTIDLFEVQDQTASAKLTAWWGTDYLLLGKTTAGWKILDVLWQSQPPRANPPANASRP